MTIHAKDLLAKMVTAIENGHENSFDELDLNVGPRFVQELIQLGFVGRENNILQSVYVLPDGFEEAKK